MNGLRTRVDMLKMAMSKNPDTAFRTKAENALTPRYSNPPRRGTAQWIDLFMKSPRMAPIHKISADVATAGYGLYVNNTKPRRKIEEHVGLKLLKKPCPIAEITEYTLFYLTELYTLLPSGESFWLLERNGFGVPAEIWIIPPHWVLETPTVSRPFFTILPQGNTSFRTIYAEPRDIIWFKDPDPLNPYGRGRGRAEGIGDEMETDEYMAKWAKKFFYNDAVPPVIGMMPGADPNVIDRQEEKWNSKYGGMNNAHKTAWINWDAKFHTLKETTKEMDFIESRRNLRDACNNFWSMSGELFGILENSNRSTIDLAYELYAKNVFSIRLKAIDDTLNRQFWPQYDEKLYIEHDSVVPTDKEFELKKSESGLKNGGITVDEWRHTNGYDSLPDGKGNILYTPLNMMPTDLNSENILNGYEDENEEDKPSKGLSMKHKTAIWKSFDRIATKYERKFEKVMKKFFQEQQNRLNKALEDERSSSFDWDGENNKLFDILEPLWMACLEEGFNFANDTYSLSLDEELGFDEDETVIKGPIASLLFRFKNWVKTFGKKTAADINKTSKERLQKSLNEGIANGESIPKLRDRVSEIYTEYKKSRCTMIARTETTRAVNAGSIETYILAGVQKKEWLSTRDSRVRDSHSRLDGQKRLIDELFSNGLMYPGDPAGPVSEVANCRCTILPIIEEEE
jgi:SPP1 gp7 family putative phage head morphogenesis protein